MGLEGTFSTGIISNFRREDDIFYIQFTAPVSPGSSGGPMLNSFGEVVGILDMQFKHGQNLNFAVLSLHVKMLVEGTTELPPDTYLDNKISVGSSPRSLETELRRSRITA